MSGSSHGIVGGPLRDWNTKDHAGAVIEPRHGTCTHDALGDLVMLVDIGLLAAAAARTHPPWRRGSSGS